MHTLFMLRDKNNSLKERVNVLISPANLLAAKNFLLSGLYAYALFGIYAFTLSPFVTRYFSLGGKSLFIAILGIGMYFAEFFAFNFKLKMIRIRAEEKRIAWRNKTGHDIIPRVGYLGWFAFFIRTCFRIVFIMISMTALGYDCTEESMSSPGVVVLCVALFADICGMFYIYFTSDLFSDLPQNIHEVKEERKEEEEWDKKNIPSEYSFNFYWKELFSDIILQIYAFMLYTAFWHYINKTGIDMVYNSLNKHESAPQAAMQLFPMLFCMVIVGLMPVRIAYWIEDSTMAFTKKEKRTMWIVFFLVAIFTCSPAIINYFSVYIFY